MAGGRERYQRGVHTVLDLKYHFVWKTKYSYKILSGDIGFRTRAVIRDDLCRTWDNGGEGECAPGSYSGSGPCAVSSFTREDGTVFKGENSDRLQRDFPELRKKY